MIKQKIKNIINNIIPKKINITDNKDLISNEILDSLSIMLLISEIEKEFNIKINMSKFSLDHFRNIKNIEKFIIKNK
tara:strand:- start:178 stop:408 length:231 start_codon:yes stop_codon:yes gene_type:complete